MPGKGPSEDPVDSAVRQHAEALEALEKGDFEDARALASNALALLERESGPDHPDVANVLNCLARVDEACADYAQAHERARRSVEIMSRVRGSGDDPDLERLYVQSLILLGNMERILARYGEAEHRLREALKIGERALGESDEDVVSVLNSLGVLFKYNGRFDEAERVYRRAIAIVEPVAGGETTLATLFHNLGGLEHARGEYARGEAPARRSVELRERALGPDHPAVAADLGALAAIVDALGRHAEAEAMYRRALEIFERVYGPAHYEIAITLNNLAGVHHAAGRHDEAEALYRRALAIKEGLLGGEHPDVAMTQNNLALLLGALGRRDEAAQLYERALRTFAGRLERGHPKIRACLENYAGLLRDHGDTAGAEALERRFRTGGTSG